jgi:O-acetyl-ADP-ribose deacetylase (regulator of RNase III)
MDIIYRTGDLLKSDQNVIVHGCNASGFAYGSGIAGQIRKRHPEACRAYLTASDADRRLGNVIWWIDASRPLIIGNAITQQTYGGDGKLYVNYDAIRMAIQNVDLFVQQWHETESHVPGIDLATVGFPLIGAGLGGGKWSIIKNFIEQESFSFQPVVYLFDGIIPTT